VLSESKNLKRSYRSLCEKQSARAVEFGRSEMEQNTEQVLDSRSVSENRRIHWHGGFVWVLPPNLLYKYLSARRLDVLTTCRVRFTQRKFFEDDHELQPDYARFGTVDEIARHIKRTPSARIPWLTLDAQARLLADNPRYQESAKQTAVQNIKSLDRMGILCLSENARSDQMWSEYAQDGSGFAIAFDTAHPGFHEMTKPLGIRRVVYRDGGFQTFLGMMEKSIYEPLFLKRVKYSFEQEWRSIRLLKDLERSAGDTYLSPFDPACVRQIIIRAQCTVEPGLRNLIAQDQRYHHVQIVEMH
jgi:hypothetical protein